MEEHATHGFDIFAPDITMLILTWVTFFILLAILHKFAWKPILKGLDDRSAHIRQSLDDADKAKAQLVEIEAQRTKILNDAKTQANGIVEQARLSANELAKQIEQKSKKEAEAIVEGATQEIAGERERVRNALKKESVNTAVALAEKILKENLDNEKSRRLINDALKDV